MLCKTISISDKSCRENQNTYFMFKNFFFLEIRAVYENVVKYSRDEETTDDNRIQHVRLICWITKVTNPCSECVIFPAFPRQQWLRECTWMIHYVYIACFVWFWTHQDLKSRNIGVHMPPPKDKYIMHSMILCIHITAGVCILLLVWMAWVR